MTVPEASLSPCSLAALVDAVQANCHIADAHHATDLPLCIYLLQMREFYRWEQGLAFGAALERRLIGQWLSQRESLWSDVESRPLQALPFDGRMFDPHDADTLNAELMPCGLVYGAGLTSVDRPTFFLAHLHRSEQRDDGLRLQVGDRELARGLAAPPAVLANGRTIVLRRESLARWLWEKFEAFSLRRTEGPFKAFVDAYALHDGAAFIAAMPRLVDEQCETLLLHELGEYRAGQWLEPGWGELRVTLDQRRTQLQLRAVRDHLADLDVTLPTLLERGAAPSLHFWFANYDGVRAQLFPSLKEAYAAWSLGDAAAALQRAVQAGSAHFRRLADEVLTLYGRSGARACAQIDRLLASPAAVCVMSSAAAGRAA
jgi:hypothetical protein